MQVVNYHFFFYEERSNTRPTLCHVGVTTALYNKLEAHVHLCHQIRSTQVKNHPLISEDFGGDFSR